MNNAVFREYDIRGKFPRDLNAETAFELGKAIGTYFQSKDVFNISVGHDCRKSYPVLKDALIKGLLETGMTVTYIGMVPSPLSYFSVYEFNLGGAVMITGSHNPPEYNGFKISLGKSTIHGEEIQKIRELLIAGVYKTGEGTLTEADIIKPYLKYLSENLVPGAIKRKVIVDAGNSVGGLVAPEAYRAMGVEVETLFCEPDGKFPNHHPDPTIPENLAELKKTVIEKNADLGIAFDGDADRIGVVDRDGGIIWGDQLMIIFARDIISRNPGAAIIGEVKCSQVLYDDIEKQGGTPIMWKAGHSLIKSKMKETGALFAGEMSGHLFFNDRFFGFDDAVYAGARLLEILTAQNKSVRDLLEGVPERVNTPEIRMECPDDKKFNVVKTLVEEFKKDYEVIDIDGARVLFDGGWGLIRSSNTQPVIVLRFEAKDEKRLEEIRSIFMEKLEKVI